MTRSSSSSNPQAPRGRRTVLLALEDYSEVLLAGVYDHAKDAGWCVLDGRHYHYVVFSRTFQPDGVILHTHTAAHITPLLKRFLRKGVPSVQLRDITPRRCCVIRDQGATGRAAAEYFRERGFTNVAYLRSETFDHSPLRLIGLSFIERARELGARAELIAVQRPGQVLPWTRFGTLAKRFAKEISRLQLPLGIFAYHDLMALRICQYCDAIGLRVPDQVAVLGIGNDPSKCDYAPTPLSSVDPDSYHQGRVAAEWLERLMDGEPAPAEPILIPPAGVVTRQSTDVLALPDVDTVRALRYMWEHLAEALSVGEVAEAVGISRRKLERHFRNYLGRSVTEELTRKRIERSCELLTGTKLTGRDIARRVGFNTQTYFGRVFRKAMGMTPRQYRLAHIARLRKAEESETPGRE